MAAEERPTLSEEDLEFVRKVAGGIRKLLPKKISFDELVSYGTIGMIEARERYDPSRGTPFRTFVHYRVRGAIYDGLRQMSWMPENAYKRLRMRERADLYMESLNAPATGTSRRAAAAALGQAVADLGVVYLTTEAAAQARHGTFEPEQPDLESACDLSKVLAEIENLSDSEKLLIRRIYLDDASLGEVGKDLDLSRSWVCRLHAKAIRKLRTRLGVRSAEAPAAPE